MKMPRNYTGVIPRNYTGEKPVCVCKNPVYLRMFRRANFSLLNIQKNVVSLRPTLKTQAMTDKSYHIAEDAPLSVSEPAVAYMPSISAPCSSDKWNPNVPFHGTQEEWFEHFHRIEEGNFMTLEEFDHKFETWKKDYLASRL